MTLKKHFYLIAGLVAVIALACTGAAGASGPGTDDGADNDQPITGSTLDECTAAALAEYPDGTVTETEAGDDGAAYEVEIRLANGSEVEINLDENCLVIGQEADDDGPDDQDDDDGPDNQDDDD